MAGPIGFGVGAARGVKRVVCPHCGNVMARSRQLEGTVTCRNCGQQFEVPPPGPVQGTRTAKRR
jgi:transcription elongation factor Elf1